ncbi:MAG: hypothetical protein J6K17_05145 [Oscillospiraceae bacterium]|nr:hypothetical protein [Oscillospiraceae bacterium]
MKKLIIAILASSLVFCGCVKQSDYDNMKNEFELQINQQQEEISQKDEEIAKLKQEIDDFKNGPYNQLVVIRNEFDKKNYDKVVELATEMHNKFPNTDEDIKAQEIAIEAKKEIQKQLNLEEERKRDAEKIRIYNLQNTIAIYVVQISDINSVGGADVKIAWESKSEETINYITFTVECYNAVGDLISCDITGDTTKNLKITGPIHKGGGNHLIIGNKMQGSEWGEVWYNNTALKVEITKVKIEYANGTSTTISGDDLEHIMDLKYKYY